MQATVQVLPILWCVMVRLSARNHHVSSTKKTYTLEETHVEPENHGVSIRKTVFQSGPCHTCHQDPCGSLPGPSAASG